MTIQYIKITNVLCRGGKNLEQSSVRSHVIGDCRHLNKLKTYLFHYHCPACNFSIFPPILIYSDCNAFAFVHLNF